MKASSTLQFYSIILLFLTTFTAAWPWPRWLPDMDAVIVRRDDTSTSAASPAASQTASPTASQTGDSKSSGSVSGSASTTGSATASGSDSSTITAAPATTDSGSSNSNSSTTDHTSYDVSYPAGGVSMLTPGVFAGSQYYKIGDNVTFAWNYTSLQATPTAVNVLATCSTASQLYTLSANMTVANATQSIVWDTGAYQTSGPGIIDPLLTATYTLIIYDAESSISATAEPGYLSVFDSYAFGMYTPQPYVGLDQWQCATCSGAMGDMERKVIGLVFGMSIITVLSFGWFVNGMNVIW